MSQKSSLLQSVKSVSQALKPDTGMVLGEKPISMSAY